MASPTFMERRGSSPSYTWSRGCADPASRLRSLPLGETVAELVAALPEVEEDRRVDGQEQVAAESPWPAEDLEDLERDAERRQHDREIRGPPDARRQERRLDAEDEGDEERGESD